MKKEIVTSEKNEDNYNLLNKTPFFIYSSGEFVKEIDKVCSTVDILPTISDLFGLDYNPNIYAGQSILNESYQGIVVFNDGTWFDGKIYYTGANDITKYISEINTYAKDLLTIGGKIIETDYFRIYDINNEKRMN